MSDEKQIDAPATKARPGRPSKLTAEVKEVLLDAIRKGMTQARAARLVAIHPETFANWQKRGAEQTKGEYFEFFEGLKKAEVGRIFACLDRIEKAGERGTWQADAWLLERCHPDEYGRQRHEVTGANGGPVETHVPIRIIQYDRIERTD